MTGEETVREILRAVSELLREQDLLHQDAERAPAARDYAVRKLVEAFKRFEVGAQAAEKPLGPFVRPSTFRVTIR
jgi:hypothetical protein